MAFCVVVAGRPMQTNFEAVDQTHYVISLENPESINHLCVFLTEPLAPALGAAVYFSYPAVEGPPQWQYLGFISNDKPSAVFKIVRDRSTVHDSNLRKLGFSQQMCTTAQLGVSLESIQSLQLETPLETADPSTNSSFTNFTTKMLENLWNYVSSFTTTPQQIMLCSSDNYVPLTRIQEWYQNFQRRLELDPNFWKN